MNATWSRALWSPPVRALTRADWIAWSIVAVGVAAVGIPVQSAVHGLWPPFALVLGIAQAGSLLLAALSPWLGALVHVLALLGIALGSAPQLAPWPLSVVSMIALSALLVLLGLHAQWRLQMVTWVAAMFGSAVLAGVVTLQRDDTDAGNGLIVAASITALAALTGAIIGLLLRQVRTAQHETELERARVAWAAERGRIAREMHDVVAHGMSVVHMRATSARYRIEGLDERAAAEFDGIAAQARDALREMRGLLGVLRDEDGVLTAPQPGLEALPALIDATRAAGTTIHADVEPIDPAPPSAVQLALYRVAQESLSNAVRHARGADITLSLTEVGEDIVLRVANGPGVAALPPSESGGHGLRGMMERMSSVSGSLAHGPDAAGGYAVEARVPRAAAQGEERA
ncbi:sensor histidine kinase [Microbacterium stercoris]|uniref:histidine kinase n=1 Tax=Microbacterium stercoris TaxID=2820289 RepID=A0A939QQV2_9MICO|nr:histidine kinase [Microbacterium stercoris]MBO3662981.1 sensor histidine kinase [Microbacterium stercoris]